MARALTLRRRRKHPRLGRLGDEPDGVALRLCAESCWAGSRFARAANNKTVRDLSYLTRLHREPSPLLLELEQQSTYDEIPIIGRASGRLLSTLVHAMMANRILEIGTGYGYSTLWMALALPPAGHIWSIDPDADRTEVARSYLTRGGVADKVDIINQPALEILEMWSQRNLDIVFIDADKTEYSAYLDLAIPMLKRSGLVIVDNLLWSGEAGAEPSARDSAGLRAVRDFSKVFLTHPQLDATIVPVGDGIGIGARIE